MNIKIKINIKINQDQDQEGGVDPAATCPATVVDQQLTIDD